MSQSDHMKVWKASDLVMRGQHLLTVDSQSASRLAQELPLEFLVPSNVDAEKSFQAKTIGIVGELAATVNDLIRTGPGFAIIQGSELDRLTDNQLSAFLYGLSHLLGTPMVQNHAGDRIVLVRDERPADPNSARGYVTSDRMLMHTDAADVSALLCLRSSASGGASLLADAVAIHDVLASEFPETLHEYYRLWTWDLRGLQRSNAAPTLLSPIFSCFAGELKCRYVSSMLRGGASYGGGRLTSEQLTALDLFEKVSQRPDLVLKHTLRRGESLWMNNYRVLHGREAFLDGSEAEYTRLLLRTWIWLDPAPIMAPSVAVMDHALFGSDRLNNA